MIIHKEFMRPPLCPICGVNLGKDPVMINIKLNNYSEMPQPICLNHMYAMCKRETQEELLEVCKEIWGKEIMESTQRTDEEKQNEIERINNLKVY